MRPSLVEHQPTSELSQLSYRHGLSGGMQHGVLGADSSLEASQMLLTYDHNATSVTAAVEATASVGKDLRVSRCLATAGTCADSSSVTTRYIGGTKVSRQPFDSCK